MIWLVDYTNYKQTIDSALIKCKQDYFKLKSYKRYNIIGDTAPVKSKIYATGLLRLATIIHYNGIDVKYLHYDMLEDAINNGDVLPNIIAFSAVCPTVPRCAELAEKIKNISPCTQVKLGGVHVNLNAKETAEKYPIFDELTVGYELQAAEKIVHRTLMPVDKIYVDYSLLPYPLSAYAINTFTAMGCPFSCEYCADGRAPHFTARCDGHLREMKSILPPKTLIHFFDSVLGYSQNGIRRICDALQRIDHKFLLSCDMRADLLTPEIIRCMEAAGFVEIRLGIESADEDLLERNKRTLTANHFNEQIHMIRENSNFYITLYSVTGLPGTTWQTQEKTLNYFDRLFKEKLVDEIKNAMYVPYPMEGVNYSKRGITITDFDWSHYDRQSYPVYHTTELTSEDLWNMYLFTAKRINASWLLSSGFTDFSQVPDMGDYYTEYVEMNYLNR